jgi:hypothetical protein
MILNPKSKKEIEAAEESLHAEYYLNYKIGDKVKHYYDVWWKTNNVGYRVCIVTGYETVYLSGMAIDGSDDQPAIIYTLRRIGNNYPDFQTWGQHLRPFNSKNFVEVAPMKYEHQKAIDCLENLIKNKSFQLSCDDSLGIFDAISILRKERIGLEGRKRK